MLKQQNRLDISSCLSSVQGIGKTYTKLLEKSGYTTVLHLITCFPKQRINIAINDEYISTIQNKALIGINCTITSSVSKKSFVILNAITCKKQEISAIIFGFAARFLYKGRKVCIAGRAELDASKIIFKQAKLFTEHKKNISVINYGISGIPNSIIHKTNLFILNNIDLYDPIPENFLKQHNLISLKDALVNMHNTFDDILIKQATYRLAFNEAILYTKEINQLKKTVSNTHSNNCKIIGPSINDIIGKLPFSLTESQCNVWKDILSDLSCSPMMFRILYGDVGSGKSIIAFLSMIYTHRANFQSLLLAPTEILAKQHATAIKNLVQDTSVYLISKGMKKMIFPNNAIIIGTHALLHRTADFQNVKLVIIDEQHKFGVHQRMFMQNCNSDYNLLLMTATPIPRSLAMSLRSFISYSVIDRHSEKMIDKVFINMDQIDALYRLVDNECRENNSVFWVCPLIQHSRYARYREQNIGNVMFRYNELYSRFGDKVIYLHGQLSQKEKDEQIELFKNSLGMILVTTSMIEVGVHIPNANLMVIENAEMFGLSQLYQLMGRVGRGDKPGVCYFIIGNKSSTSIKRMHAIQNSMTGIDLASKDLEIRGGGNIFGLKQSGKETYQFFDIDKDIDKILLAQKFIGQYDDVDLEMIGMIHGSFVEGVWIAG